MLHLATWIINIAFWISLIPQVFLNFKLKSTEGLSDSMIYFYFVGYITYCYYIFCCGLPYAYKLFGPICFLTTLVMVAQRFIYQQRYKTDSFLLLVYAIHMCMAIVLLPFSWWYPRVVGSVTGWIQVIIWIFYQTPQVYKVHRSRSVVGFSFLLVSFIALGELIEILIAVGLRLPTQTIVNGTRGMLMYVIFCVQFWLYRKKDMYVLPARECDGLSVVAPLEKQKERNA